MKLNIINGVCMVLTVILLGISGTSQTASKPKLLIKQSQTQSVTSSVIIAPDGSVKVTKGKLPIELGEIASLTATEGKQEHQPNFVSRGVLNAKATKIHTPLYPSLARKIQAQGSVPVKIVIDEQGKVIAARALNGHPLLRRPSQNASLLWEFAPLLLSGKPVRATGLINYDYIIEKF